MLIYLNGFIKPIVNKPHISKSKSIHLNLWMLHMLGRVRADGGVKMTHTLAHELESQKFVRLCHLQTLTRFGDDDDDETERKSKQDYF